MTISRDDIARLRAIADAATAGPWTEVRDGFGELVAFDNACRKADGAWHVSASGTLYMSDDDAAFIAESRTAIPRLLDALEEAEADLAAAREAHQQTARTLLAEAQEVERLRGELYDLIGYVQPNATSPATDDLRGLAEREAGR